MELLVKNMVCNRCIRVVKDELQNLGITVNNIELGRVDTLEELGESTIAIVRQTLFDNGFELIDNRKHALVDAIKKILIEEVQYLKGNKPDNMNYSEFLSQKMGYEYSYLSHLFSQETDQTIEQYIIALRIEKAKELLSYNELKVSEIAWILGYSSVAHLSGQFKKVTGQSPAAYKESKIEDRIPLDLLGNIKS